MLKRVAGLTGIAIMMAVLTVWAGPPQNLPQCRSMFAQDFKELDQLYQRLVSVRALSQQEFQEMNGRMRNLHQRLNDQRLNLPGCQNALNEIAYLRSRLQKTAVNPHDPRTDQCRSQTSQAVQNTSQLFGQACKSGYVSRTDAQICSDIERRRSQIMQNVNRSNLTLTECQEFASNAAKDRSVLQKIAADREQVQRCRASNQSALGQVAEFVRILGSKNLLPPERSILDIKKKRLGEIDQNLRNPDLSLALCQQLSSEIAAENTNIRNMLAATASRDQVQPCRAQNNMGLSETFKLLERACTTRNLSSSEASNCQSLSNRLDMFRQKLNSPNLTMQECQQLSRDISMERNKIEAMIR